MTPASNARSARRWIAILTGLGVMAALLPVAAAVVTAKPAAAQAVPAAEDKVALCDMGYGTMGCDLRVGSIVGPTITVRPSPGDIFQKETITWAPIEEAARLAVATLSGVPANSRVVTHGRNEILAYVLEEMRQVSWEIDAGESVISQEVAAANLVKKSVKDFRVRQAQIAKNEYDKWNLDVCSYHFPTSAGFTTDYQQDGDVRLWCDWTGPPDPSLQKPSPPSADTFSYVGLMEAYDEKGLLTDEAGNAVMEQAHLWASIAGTIGAGAAAVGAQQLVARVPRLSEWITKRFFPYASRAYFRGEKVVPGLLQKFGGRLTQSQAIAKLTARGVRAISKGVGAAVAAVIFGAVEIGIAIWQLWVDEQVPISLDKRLAAAQAENPTLKDLFASDEGVLDVMNMLHWFSQPNNSSSWVNPADVPPPDAARDGHFVVSSFGFPSPGDGDVTVLRYVDWQGEGKCARLTPDNWWIVTSSLACNQPTLRLPAAYDLQLQMKDPLGRRIAVQRDYTGENWGAFRATHIEATADELAPGDDDSPEDGLRDSYASTVLPFVAAQGAEGYTYDGLRVNWCDRLDSSCTAPALEVKTMRLIPNRAPELESLSVAGPTAGRLVQGQQVSLNALAHDPEGGAVSYRWELEPDNDHLELSSTSRPVSCYPDPAQAINISLCPWTVLTGSSASTVWNFAGRRHVRFVATDPAGARTVREFVVTVDPAEPLLPRLDLAVTNPTGLSDSDASNRRLIQSGGSIRLFGDVLSPPVAEGLEMHIDWGDGQQVVLRSNPCGSGDCTKGLPPTCSLCWMESPPQGDFLEPRVRHVYDTLPGGPFSVKVTIGILGADGGGTVTKTFDLAPWDPARDDVYGLTEDTALTVAAVDGVLKNDAAPTTFGDQLTVETQPAHGTLNFAPDGAFTYTPAANYQGVDNFRYVRDGDIASVRFNVAPVPDAPLLGLEPCRGPLSEIIQCPGGVQWTTTEGRSITVRGLVWDPDRDESSSGTLEVDWGDGATQTFRYGCGTAAPDCLVLGQPNYTNCTVFPCLGRNLPAPESESFFFGLTHAYGDNGRYAIKIKATDATHRASTLTSAAEVTNVAPTAEVGAAFPTDENGLGGMNVVVKDPGPRDTLTMDVDWGDGTVETLPVQSGNAPIGLLHQYRDDNPSGTASDNYTVKVTVKDDDGGVGTATTPIGVNNVAPVVTSASFSNAPLSGLPTTLDATWADVGSLDTHTIAVDWGDGTTSAPVAAIAQAALGHIYPRAGQFRAIVTVKDDDGGTATRNVDVTVGHFVDCTRVVSGPVPGSLSVSSGTTCIQGASIGGSVTVSGGANAVIVNSTIGGMVTGSSAGIVGVCASTVLGAISIQNSSGFALLGGHGARGCAGNTLNGNVMISGSRAGLRLAGNGIKYAASVTNNRAAGLDPLTQAAAGIIVSANTTAGTLTCSGNTPAASNGGQPNIGGRRVGECALPTF